MNAMTTLGCAAVLGFVLVGCQSTPSPGTFEGKALFVDSDGDGLPDARVDSSVLRTEAPQGKEPVAVAGQMPRLADVLKGYVEQECVAGWNDSCRVWLTFDPRDKGEKRKLEMVGQDFVKLSGEWVVPFTSLAWIYLKKP